MATLTLLDGRTLDVRPMYLSDKSKIIELDKQATDTEMSLHDRMLGYLAVLRPAVSGKSWDGDLADMTELQLLTALWAWGAATEDDAIPPETGTSSETP